MSPGALTLSPALLEGYTSAAGKISRLAVGDVNTPVADHLPHSRGHLAGLSH